MPRSVAYKAEVEHIQILDEEGVLDEELAQDTLTDEQVLSLYEMMSVCRHLDEVAFKLQRSGRMGTYPQNKGQEAVGAVALAASRQDWMAPCYRENIALFLHGLPMEKVLLHWMGDERGNQIPEDVRALPLSIPIGTHMLHAAGLAWSMKLRGEPNVAFTFFGDGATSEGDFHEAMNFAGALKLPVVFICQNNQWAISVPRARQTASETFAQKGLAYGAHVVQIDGNDIFAYHKVTTEARKRALEEGRPTLIEGVTYRLGDHTTADDARRYRDPDELDVWVKRDPILRIRRYLDRGGLWSDEKQAELDSTVKQRVTQVVENAAGIATPDSSDFFDDMYANLPRDLAEQRDRMQTHSLALDPDQERLSARPPAAAAS